MTTLADIAKLESGPSQFRIKESSSEGAAMYSFYGHAELEDDLVGLSSRPESAQCIRTANKVSVVRKGDLVFGLVLGKAAIVQPDHEGYLFTQNFARIVPSSAIDGSYLAYLLNESSDVRHQLAVSQQGSSVMRFTVRQLAALQVPTLPSLKVQKAAGSAYFSQLRLAALKKRQADLETALVLGKLKEALCS